MTATPAGITETDEARRDALVQRLFAATLNALELLHVYIGDRLGLYRVMADGESAMSASELASAASISERYAREWLEQQAVAGILDLDLAEPGLERRFRLPVAHMEVLLDADSLS